MLKYTSPPRCAHGLGLRRQARLQAALGLGSCQTNTLSSGPALQEKVVLDGTQRERRAENVHSGPESPV